MQKTIYSTDEVAKMLNVNKTTVKRWTDEGKIQCERTPGHHRKFSTDNILEFAMKNNYQVERLQREMSIKKDSFTLKQLAFENNGNFLHSVILSLTLKGQKHEIVTIFHDLNVENISYTQIVRSFIFPIIMKIERLLLIEKVDEREFMIANKTIVNALVMFGSQIQMVKRRNSVVVIFSFDQSLKLDLMILESKLEVDGYLVFNLGIINSWNVVFNMIKSYSSFTILALVQQSHNQHIHIKDFMALERIADERDQLFLCGTIQKFIELDVENANKLYRPFHMKVEEQFEFQ